MALPKKILLPQLKKLLRAKTHKTIIMTQVHRAFYAFRSFIICLALVLVCVHGSSCKAPKPLTVEKVGNVRMMKDPPFLVDVQFYNPNHYAIEMKHADVEVYMNGTHMGRMQLDTLISAPARSSFQLPVGLNIDLVSVLPNVGELLFSKTVHIKLDGSLKVGRKGVFINIPLHYEGDQVPDRLEMKLFNGMK
jgi:LEA14-like dessication related protein